MDNPTAAATTTTTATTFHAVMFPWFAMGHILAYLRISNEFAAKGHRVSFLVPKKTISKLQPLNLHPDFIEFVPVSIPHVDGLPLGAETMSDVSIKFGHFLAIALDLMQQQIQEVLQKLKPDFIFYDYGYWMPKVARPMKIKSVYYSTVAASTFVEMSEEVDESIVIFIKQEFGIGITFPKRIDACFEDSDIIAFRGCYELEGKSLKHLEEKYKKPLLVSGPLLDTLDLPPLEERWDKWLSSFPERSVVYCSLGSEWVMTKEEFQELVLGMELTGYPFFLSLKVVPVGVETLEEAYPEGFEEKMKGKGVVHTGWVQQSIILKHPSVGCFLTHCGAASMLESLINDPQVVLMPQAGDQFTNATMLESKFKIGLKVERNEDGKFTKESMCKAIKIMMDPEDSYAKQAKEYHVKWKSLLLKEGFEDNYMNNFISKLQELV